MTALPFEMGAPLASQPLWVILIAVSAILMAAHELGVRLRRWSRASFDQDDADDDGQAYLSTSLSLLVLLVAFSFGMSVDHYNKRRILVSAEASAISTTYRRLQALDEPASSTLRSAFVPYVAAREAFSRAETPDQMRRAEVRADALQAQFWSNVVRTVGSRDLAARSVLDAASEMFNAAHARRAAIEATFPRVILISLVIFATIAAVFTGYTRLRPRRYLVPSSIQFMLLALAIGLIVDLDRPRSGLVQVDQAPLYRAAALVRQAQAAADRMGNNP